MKGTEANEEYRAPLPKWIKAGAYAAISGYTDTAINQKRNLGVWPEGVIWIKAPDGKVFINWRKADEWIEGSV